MQLKKISLFSNNEQQRDIDFNLSSLNIITGASKKGKTSVLEIVEYCLGSSECGVAAGYIRDSVSWYSILLQFDDTQVFIARKAPLPSIKACSDVCLIVDKEVNIPTSQELKKNSNIDSVVKYLANKIGIPEQITEVGESHTRSPIQLAFKHSRYFLFQSQDEIANKRVLFHRQAEPFIPQMIKDTLPYFLGAVDDDRFSELERLRTLKRQKTKIMKQLREIEAMKGEGLQKGFKLLAEAAQIGLYGGNTFAMKDQELIETLIEIKEWKAEKFKPFMDDGRVEELENKYKEHRNKKRIINSKLEEAQQYVNAMSGYENENTEQTLRLQSIGIFSKLNTVDIPYKDRIISALEILDSGLSETRRLQPKVEQHLQNLRSERTGIAEKIKTTQEVLATLRKNDDKSIKLQDLDIERAKVVGRISLYLDGIKWHEDVSNFKTQISYLDSQIRELEEILDPEVLQEKLDAQLNLIGLDMTRWAQELKLEHSEHPIKLDVKKLTVVADTPMGRIPLQQMGSGENWVGYHLVTYLALAKWFIHQNRPVANFVFFDQPSQVYFPTDLSKTGDLGEIKDDEDRIAVKKMFQWLYRVMSEEFNDKFQIIVTDHADIEEPWFQDSIIDKKWRGDEALIPMSWIK